MCPLYVVVSACLAARQYDKAAKGAEAEEASEEPKVDKRPAVKV